jgi:hypothetical protein
LGWWTTPRRCQQPNKPSHVPPHQSTSPWHYPNIKWGTTFHNNNLEDGAPLEDKEEDMAVEVDMAAVADGPNMEEDVATQAYQCHTSEAIN